MRNEIKREIFFKKFSKKNEIEKQRTNRDNRSKAKRKSESRKTWHLKKSKKKQHQMILKLKISRNRKQNFAFFFDRKTKKYKHRNTETINNDCHSINKIIFFDRWYRWDHRRIKQTKTTNFNINQRNFYEIIETLKNLIFVKDFHFHDRKNNDSNDFDLLFRKLNENLWKRQQRNKKKFVLNENFKTISETFSLFLTHDERKKKKN